MTESDVLVKCPTCGQVAPNMISLVEKGCQVCGGKVRRLEGEWIGRDQFSVYQFFTNGSHEEAARFVGAERSLVVARALCRSVAAQFGTVNKVMITDGGDCCVFEWRHGEGVVWPLELKGIL